MGLVPSCNIKLTQNEIKTTLDIAHNLIVKTEVEFLKHYSGEKTKLDDN